MPDSSFDIQRVVRETYGAVVPQDSNVAEALYDQEDLDYLPIDVRMLALGLTRCATRSYAKARLYWTWAAEAESIRSSLAAM